MDHSGVGLADRLVDGELRVAGELGLREFLGLEELDDVDVRRREDVGEHGVGRSALGEASRPLI